MKPFIIILVLVSIAISGYADSWGHPSPAGAISPSGRFVLRILPGDSQSGKKPLAVIFELSRDGENYDKRQEFPLVNR